MEERTNYWLRRRLSRRTTLKASAIAGAGAATLALVGCGDDDDDGGEGDKGLLPTAAASPTAAKQPKAGGSFSFQIPSPPPSLDPYTQTSYLNGYMNGLSYSKLLRFKAGVPEVAPADNSMEPDLAQAMPEQPNELTFVFKLKPNAKFHNGRALTSEDVSYAFDRYRNYEKSVHKSGLSFVDKIETPTLRPSESRRRRLTPTRPSIWAATSESGSRRKSTPKLTPPTPRWSAPAPSSTPSFRLASA